MRWLLSPRHDFISGMIRWTEGWFFWSVQSWSKDFVCIGVKLGVVFRGCNVSILLFWFFSGMFLFLMKLLEVLRCFFVWRDVEGLFLKKCSSLLATSIKAIYRAACGGLSVLEESLDIILCSLYFFVFFFSFLIYFLFGNCFPSFPCVIYRQFVAGKIVFINWVHQQTWGRGRRLIHGWLGRDVVTGFTSWAAVGRVTFLMLS